MPNDTTKEKITVAKTDARIKELEQELAIEKRVNERLAAAGVSSVPTAGTTASTLKVRTAGKDAKVSEVITKDSK